jgi:hypothetical protein
MLAADGTPYLSGAAIDVTARHEAAALQRRLEAESARRAEIEASPARVVGDVTRRAGGSSAISTTARSSSSSSSRSR